MKIENTKNLYNPALDASKKPASLPVGESAQPAKADGDAFSVALSSAVEKLKTAPEPEDDQARRDKVQAIRQQLASGTYNLSGKDVANKIVNNLKG
ncbi:MAG TPA: flagellar biosynthesis anti-sigma factor FlgM [Desulfuromonadaceae bacterium]|jgi:negative regulator of flagellin synthesis FlgM